VQTYILLHQIIRYPKNLLYVKIALPAGCFNAFTKVADGFKGPALIPSSFYHFLRKRTSIFLS
jgi:hypothetical protein